MRKFRLLRADEIECRVGTINENGFTLLLYKDARCDQNILDDTVGEMNWQRDHKEVKGNMFCGVAIYDDAKGQWITKWDCGTESNTEKEKGEASDSFKRACFNWGIGRELYTAPFIYIKGNTEKDSKGKDKPTFKSIKVVEIGHNEEKISRLVISGDGSVIYTYGKDAGQAPKKPNTDFIPPKSLAEELETARWTQGKHTGELIKDTDTDYLKWYVDKGLDKRVVELCKLAIKDKEFYEGMTEVATEDDGLLPWD